MLRLLEDALPLRVCGEAILLDAIDDVVKDRYHELLLRALFAARREVLRWEDGVELVRANGNLLG
jgi:hypothetical protein